MTRRYFRSIATVVFGFVLVLALACARGVSDESVDSFTDNALSRDASAASQGPDTARDPSADDSSTSRPSPTAPFGNGADANGFDVSEGEPSPSDRDARDEDDDGAYAAQVAGDDADEAFPIDAKPGAGDVVSTAATGDLIITEIMFAPSGFEPQSEWFEIYNATAVPKLLSGLTIEDGYPRTHVIAASPPVIAPAQAYVVLVRDRAVALANVIPAAAIAYEYGADLLPGQGIGLENGAAGAISLWNGDTQLANVPYGPWEMASFGQSIELDALQSLGSDSQPNWCLAQNPWAAGPDYGTPGASNDCP